MNDKITSHESIIDMKWVEKDGKNVLMEKIRHSDGSTEWKYVEEPKISNTEFDERFKGTQTIPLDLEPAQTDILVRKAVEHIADSSSDVRTKLLEEYMDKLLKIHAILIRVVGGQPINIVNAPTP